MKTYIGVYLCSVVLALAITPVVIWLARRMGAMDYPGVRSIHKKAVPRIGGVAIFVSSMCLILLGMYLRNDIGAAFREAHRQLATLLGSATFVFLVGLADDLKGLPARFKFLAELAAAGALCLGGVRIDTLGIRDHSVISLGWLGCPLTLLWVVGITNAINLSDGLDGLAAGISAITSAVIAILAIYRGNVIMAVFALALAGSLSGFLFFNFHPAKVFMGDCGSLFLGFILAASSVMCMTKSSALVGLTLPALALGIPIFDTLFSMLRRYLERRSLFAPDRGHFHHRLLDLGLHQRHAVMTIYVLTLLSSGLGLFMMVSHDPGSLIVFGGALLLLLVVFRVVGAVRLRETLVRLQARYRISRQERAQRAMFEHAQLQLQQARDVDQWWQAICETAGQMGFAWVARTRTFGDGRTATDFWQAPVRTPVVSRLLQMTVPYGGVPEEAAQKFEIAVCVNNSLEDACHRASLFGRLIDTPGIAEVAAAHRAGRGSRPNGSEWTTAGFGRDAAAVAEPTTRFLTSAREDRLPWHEP